MPKLRAPILSFLARGRLGKYTSYRRGSSGPQAIATPTHPDANTDLQQAQRSKFALGRDWWYDLTPEGKDYFPAPYLPKLTPFAAWLKYWLNALVVPHAPQHITTTGDDPLYTDPLITQTNLGQLVDGGETDLHTHAAVGGGVAPIPGFISGRYYGAIATGGARTTVILSANIMRAMPFSVPVATTFDRLGIRVTTGVAGKLRLGVYADNGGNPDGGALLQDSGELDTAVAGDKEATINLTLQPGWYWLAELANAGPYVRGATVALTIALLGAAALIDTGHGTRVWANITYGPLPNPCPATTPENGAQHAIMLRKA